MLDVKLEIPSDVIAALETDALRTGLGAMCSKIFVDVDGYLFGKGGAVAHAMKQGKDGGGPFGWKKLTPKYREWKERQMKSGAKLRPTFATKIEIVDGKVVVVGGKASSLIRNKDGKLRARANVYHSAKHKKVVSADVWVRTGAFRDRVVFAEIASKSPSGRKDYRSRKITRGRDVVTYRVDIDNNVSYWTYADDLRKIFADSHRMQMSVDTIVGYHMADFAESVVGAGEQFERAVA